jgi:hypothetical protein
MRTLVLLLAQLLIGAALLVPAWRRSAEWDAARRLPAAHREPLRVGPLWDDPRVVTDEQLLDVLAKLRPRLRGEKPKINHVDHALRFWGVEAEFRDPECLSGAEMRDLLLDHRRFAGAWGETPPLLMTAGAGVRVRTQEGQATASHTDHTLGCLAEAGVSLDHPIVTPRGETTVRALLEQSLRDFSLNQVEYEWSALAYNLYLGPTEGWLSSEGQAITFDRIAERLMRQRPEQGVCMGNHRLHALVMLLRAEDQTPRLSPEMRSRVVAHLQDATGRLVASQRPEGFWLIDWPYGDSGRPLEPGQDTLANRILATGHALEWWSLAPDEVQPPRETVIRAGQWLARTVSEMDDHHIQRNYTFLSHAGRALSLWRGRLPSALAEQIDEAPANSTFDSSM